MYIHVSNSFRDSLITTRIRRNPKHLCSVNVLGHQHLLYEYHVWGHGRVPLVFVLHGHVEPPSS